MQTNLKMFSLLKHVKACGLSWKRSNDLCWYQHKINAKVPQGDINLFKACQPFNLAVILYKSQFKQFLLNILADIIWRSLFIWKLLVIKNETHVKKVGRTSEFLFNIYWWTFFKKNNYLFKKLLNWANEKYKNFNIYNVTLFKKIKKNTWRYHYFAPLYQKSW